MAWLVSSGLLFLSHQMKQIEAVFFFAGNETVQSQVRHPHPIDY